MDVLGKMVQGTGCSVDGTVSAQNPLSKALNNVLQSQVHGRGPQAAAAMGPPPPHMMQMQRNNFARGADAQAMQAFEQEARQRAHMEAAFHAGEGQHAHMMHHQHHASMEAAFEDAQRMQAHPGGHFGPMHQSPHSHHPHQQMQGPHHGQDAWVNDFKSMHLDNAWGNAGKTRHEAAWDESKAMIPQHNHMHPMQHMDQQRTVGTVQEMDARKLQTMQASSDMARTMSQNPDPKFQNSDFLKFMNQVSSGEVDLDEEKNAVVGADGALEGAWGDTADGVRVNRDLFDSTWGEERSAKASSMENAFREAGPAQTSGMDSAWSEARNPQAASMDGAWSDARTVEEKSMDAAWKDSDSLEAMWEKAMAEAKTTDPFEDVWDNMNQTSEYVYQGDNPFLEATENFQRGVDLFKSGHLTDAIMAFEAEVQQHPENSEAWRMLGECHAENDEDKSAIICLERAVEEDPYNLSALLALGVSHVNELNPQGALKTLKAWVQHNPKFHGFEIQLDEYSDGSLMDEVMQLMLQARAHDPEDTDVQVVLGVLYNVSKDYGAAVESFKMASEARPDEYSLWNKLGATLANSSRSSEAIPAYHRALEMKPRYARGWLNLGISHANLGSYEEATKCYLQALSLNDRADHIWSYLRICFTCMERFDLVKLADTRDVSVFREEFNLIDL